MNILYIRKKPATNTWSNVLQRQFEAFRIYSKGKADVYEVDTSGLWAYVKNVGLIFRALQENNFELVYVNHIICAYPFLLASFFLRKKPKKILALHETEPVLGWQFVKRNRDMLTTKEKLRYTKVMTWPIRHFGHIVVLNKRQKRRCPSQCTQLNFLGGIVDTVEKEKLTVGDPVKIFFPHNISRPEKGFQFTQDALKNVKFPFHLRKGGGIPYGEMRHHYALSHIVMLTGSYETYSLVLLEAMGANCFIVATREIGLIENLQEKYSEDQLLEFGLYIVDQNAMSISRALEKLYPSILKGEVAKTQALMVKEELTETECNKKLYRFLEDFNADRLPVR